MVSFIISIPDLMIKADMRNPTYASKLNPVNIYINADMNTDSDMTASNDASAPDDLRE